MENKLGVVLYTVIWLAYVFYEFPSSLHLLLSKALYPVLFILVLSYASPLITLELKERRGAVTAGIVGVVYLFSAFAAGSLLQPLQIKLGIIEMFPIYVLMAAGLILTAVVLLF